MSESTGVELHDVSVHHGRRRILGDVSVAVPAQNFTAVVGPNGCGKSTLLQAIAGLHPFTGSIRINGRGLRDYPRRERVEQLAYVEQAGVGGADARVDEIVELGRLAGRGLFARTGPEDRHIISRAMSDADVTGISERTYPTLSGGERQRTHVARALAQDASVIILDEPTNHLDLNHQHQLMQQLRHLAHESHHGCAVLLAVHDLGLAARYCDDLIVLHAGRVAAFGPPAEVLSQQLLAEVFGIRGQLMVSPQGSVLLDCLGPV